MDEKYIIYIIPSSGKKMYVPEVEVDSFERDYPDAVLYSDSQLYKDEQEAKAQGEYEEARRNSSIDEQLKGIEAIGDEEIELSEDERNKDSRDQRQKDIDLFFNTVRPGSTIKRNLEDDFGKINPDAAGVGQNYKTKEYFERYNKEPATVLRNKKTGETIAWDGNSEYDTDVYEEAKDNNAYDYTVAPMDFLDYDYEGGRKTITKAPQSGILDNNRENLIPLFNNLYNDWGFTFSGTDMNPDGTEVTDNEKDVIWATARNGEKIKVHVDNDDLYSNILRFGYMGDPDEDNVATRTNQKELAKLKNFMNQNMGEYKPITYEDLKKQKGNRLAGFYDEKLIMGELDNVEKKANALDNLGKTISEDIEVLNADYKQLQEDAANGVYKTQKELDAKIKEIKDREEQIKSDQLALKGVYDKEVQQNFIDIKKVAAEQIEVDAQKGAWWMSVLNMVPKSLDDLPEFLEDQVSAVVEYGLKGAASVTGKKASDIAEDLGFQDGKELILGKKDDETESEYTQRLVDNTKIYTDALGRGFLERQFGMDNESITNVFDQRYKETTQGAVLTSITQMLTYALISRGVGGGAAGATRAGAGITGRIGSALKGSLKSPITYMFGASASANSMDEMQGPAFKGVSTIEKLAFSNLRGGVQGILENIGFSGAVNANPLINNLIINAIKKKGSKATYKTLEGAIKKEITNKYLRGGLRMLGGGLAEGETEIIQELADVGLKNAFNAVKKAGVLDKENSPELFNKQATDLSVDNLLKAGKVGMLSGFIFGGYGASVQAYQENALDKLNKKNFALTEALIKSPEYNKLYRSNLRAEVQQGKITKEEALENLRAVRQMGQVYKQMPKGLTNEGRQQAFSLSLEKQKLEQEVANKDKNLYKPELDRIAEINTELETIAFEQTKAKQLARNLQLTEDISGERKIDFASFENQEGFEQALQEKGIDSKDVVAYDREGKSLTYGDAADGLYLDLGNGTILINEKVAEKTGAISVGTHELLHDILRDRLRTGPMTTSQLVNDFKGVLSKKEMDVVGKRVRDSYGDNPTTEEWFTAFHDAIVKGDIKYSEGLGAKLAKWLTENILKPMGFKKAGFATGRQAYNFIKDYSLQTKAVVEGRQEGLTGDVGVQVLQKSDAPVSTDVTAQPSVSQDIVAENTRLSEELSDAVERGDQQAITDIKNDLFLNNQGIINEFVNSKFKDGLGLSRQDFNDAVVEEVLLRLNQTYDPSKGEYGAYIREALFGGGRFGGGRLGNILRRLGQEGDLFTKDVGDTDVEVQTAVEQEDVAEETRRKPKIKLKDRLTGDIKPILDAINAQIKNLDIDNLNFKSLKNLALNQVQELFGITPKPGNLTKADVRAAQQYINKNADALIALLPEGATPSGTSTGVQKVLLDNFYNKRERAKMAKTGSAAGLAIFEKKSNINPKDFKAVFGITPAGQPNLADRNTSARIKALVAQTERMLVNQQVREVLGKQGRELPSAITEGKSDQMFSITQEAFTQEQQEQLQEISQIRDIRKVVKKLGLGSIAVTEGNRKDLQLSIETAIKEYGLSVNVFEAAMPASAGAVRVEVGRDSADGRKLQKFLDDNKIKAKQGEYYYALDNGKWEKAETKGKSIKPPAGVTNLVPARGRLYYGKDDPAYKRAMAAAESFGGKDIAKPKRITIKKGVRITLDWLNTATRKNAPTRAEQMDINMDVLEDVSLQLQNAVQAGMDPKIAAILITQGYQATNGIIKISAPWSYVSEKFEYSDDPKSKQSKGPVPYREEHNPPASVIGATLIDAIVNNKVQSIFPFIRENFYQTQLSFKDDYKLDIAKLDSTLPEGTSVLNNSAIRLAKAGINLNTLINPRTGTTMAQDLGVALPNDVKYNETAVARQNQLIEEMIMENGNTELIQEQLIAEVPVFKSQEQATKDNEQINSSSRVMPSISLSNGETINQSKILDKALDNARALNMPIKKIRVFDFDDTLAKSNSLVFYTKKDGSQGQLTAEQFAEKGAELVADGAVMDFSDFNIVREGERGPLFDIAKKIKEARGNEDLFVLTARAPEAAQAIYDFLKAEGLEFKKENIIGLGNSTGEAKAAWLVGKAAEGYNDFYFADDAMANVDAVNLAMSQLDVKSRVQRAMPKLSVTLDKEFNNIIEQSTGISSDREYSAAKAQTLGSTKGKFKFFVPYSAEDFVGLIYKTLGKGALGDQQMAWYKENLLDPFARAMQSLSQARVQLMSDFRKLKKDLKNVPKTLRKKTADGFTYEQAVRAYIWDKQGIKVPGLDASDMKEFRKIVLGDPDLRAFAEQLMDINKTGSYPPPDASWLAGNIASDLQNGLNTISRKQFLQQWQQNVDAIYSEKNLNKLEALYGSKYREALENILQRMKTGRNRLEGGSRLADRMLNYINGSIGAIMFFNMRSAVLQTISAINFMNWSDNNPLAAGKAFANQSQYWSDFMMLMNSDFLRDRRDGVRLNVSESEIADLAKTSKNKAKAVMAYIIEKGYLPTKFADSFAISLGGATFYRNRLNTYLKQGLTDSEARERAMLDFREVAEESQQSSRPDRISQQQASSMGRLLLAFANTPMQYTRLTKKAFQDLINGRGDRKTNISKIVYYMTAQNLIFNALQSGLFALGFGDEEEDDEKKEKMYLRTANGMADSFLRGMGIGGQAVSVTKNWLLDLYERSGRSRPDYVDSVYKLLQFSPPISSKVSRLRQAAYPFDSKKRRQEMIDKGFSLDNPAYESIAKVISATTNLPADRVLLKYKNIETAMTEDLQTWQKIAMLLGWPAWQIAGDKKEQEKPKSNNKRTQKRTGGRLQSRTTRLQTR